MTRRTSSVARSAAVLATWWLLVVPVIAEAQELVPAAYTPAPVGVNLVTLAAGYSSGDVTFDPSLPVEDGSASITAGSISYSRTFGAFGRSANATVIVPCVTGRIDGLLLGEYAFAERTGPADLALRFGVNLFGAPAMDGATFRSFRPRTLVGASLLVRCPTGEYDSSKLINIGTNRWAFKPEIGVVHVVGRWAFDGYLGGWLFTDNTDFFGGTTRSQDPIYSTEAHVRHRIDPRLWASLDVNFWRGGVTEVDGAERDDLQSNSRVGLTVAWQVARQHGLRLAYSRGALTRIGGDFDSIGLSYSYSWMGER